MKVKVIDDSAILDKIFHIRYEHKCSLCMLACSSYLSPPQALRLQSRASSKHEKLGTSTRGITGRGKERGETPARKGVDFLAILSFSRHVTFPEF